MRLLSLLPALVTLLAFSFGPAFANAPDPVEADLQPPALASEITVFIPRQLLHLPMKDPRVEFRIRIAADGALEDFVCLYATHPGLIDPAMEKLEQATFTPAWEDGQAFTSDLGLTIEFTRDSVSEQSIGDHIESIEYQMNEDAYTFQLSEIRELDAPPQIVERGELYAPMDENGQRIAGKATVEAYIDQAGSLHMLRLANSTDPEVGNAALLTFRNFRFAPPTRNGKPTAVKVRLPYLSSAD